MEGNIRSNIKENLQENIQENLHEFAERRKYYQYAKVMAGGMVTLIGTILAIYIGGWVMLLVPLKEAVTALLVGALTKRMILVTALKCALSLTTAGAIWCASYIINRKIIGYEEC